MNTVILVIKLSNLNSIIFCLAWGTYAADSIISVGCSEPNIAFIAIRRQYEIRVPEYMRIRDESDGHVKFIVQIMILIFVIKKHHAICEHRYAPCHSNRMRCAHKSVSEQKTLEIHFFLFFSI